MSIGDAFNSLGEPLRRPVEILGLLQLATQVTPLDGGEMLDTFETVRPDGSRRSFTVPRITLDNNETAALSALDNGLHND